MKMSFNNISMFLHCISIYILRLFVISLWFRHLFEYLKIYGSVYFWTYSDVQVTIAMAWIHEQAIHFHFLNFYLKLYGNNYRHIRSCKNTTEACVPFLPPASHAINDITGSDFTNFFMSRFVVCVCICVCIFSVLCIF